MSMPGLFRTITNERNKIVPIYMYIYIHIYIHCITLHYIRLDQIRLHYITLHYIHIWLRCVPLSYALGAGGGVLMCILEISTCICTYRIRYIGSEEAMFEQLWVVKQYVRSEEGVFVVCRYKKHQVRNIYCGYA